MDYDLNFLPKKMDVADRREVLSSNNQLNHYLDFFDTFKITSLCDFGKRLSSLSLS